MKINYFKLIASVILCQLAGFIGSIFTITSIGSWYSQLIKPSFNPPNWVFGPVWTLLYLLMGISLFLVWNKGVKTKTERQAVFLFILQLALNTLWSMLFFGVQAVFFAFIEILFLWAAILLSVIWFYRINKTASFLLIPYILWVSFAAVLNLSIYVLN